MTTVSALCIGDELLDGRISEGNSTWLAQQLSEVGTHLRSVRIVGDDVDEIAAALDEAAGQADLVVVSGGLGPTSDDVTRQGAAQWADVQLELDEEVLERLKRRFAQYDYPFSDNNRRQCLFPAGADVLPTEVGTAAGFAVHGEGARAVFFPGVPTEFRWFVETYILPELGDESDALVHSQLTFFGPGESQLESKLDGIEALCEELGARVGYRAHVPVIEVLLKAPDTASLQTLREFVLERVGAWVIAEDGEPFVTRLGEALTARSATVATAESCTAGRVAAKLTEVSGASAWFERGYLTYANSAKEEMLGVEAAVLEEFGAVSAQTVCQMASGAQRAADADFALATSGIAGPTGGTPTKPVGTVHFGLATPEGVYHRRVQFPARGRQRVLTSSVFTICSLLLWYLEERLDEHHIDGPFSDEQVWAPGGIRIEDREES